MFQIGVSFDIPLLNQIEDELKRRPLPINKYRTNSGEGRSQCFGIVRQRNHTYTGSRMNFERPALYDMLIRLGNLILPPDFSYVSIQLNQNYMTAPHKDAGNKGVSAILGFGDYTGGDLVIEQSAVSIKNRLVFFDGSLYTHHTLPFEGNRYSIVYHTPHKEFKDIPIFSFTIVKGKLSLVESIGGVRRVYNQKGNCIESSDGIIPERKARCPSLRACVE